MKNTFDRLITRLHMAKGEISEISKTKVKRTKAKRNNCRTTTDSVIYVKWNYQKRREKISMERVDEDTCDSDE